MTQMSKPPVGARSLVNAIDRPSGDTTGWSLLTPRVCVTCVTCSPWESIVKIWLLLANAITPGAPGGRGESRIVTVASPRSIVAPSAYRMCPTKLSGGSSLLSQKMLTTTGALTSPGRNVTRMSFAA